MDMWMLIRFSSSQVSVGASWQFLIGLLILELQFSDIEREPTAEETETAKWEDYASLVSKMTRELATGVDVESNTELMWRATPTGLQRAAVGIPRHCRSYCCFDEVSMLICLTQSIGRV